MEQQTIRVLHVFHSLGCGGAETMIMNIYRHIDRAKIQFDFMVHSQEKGFFEDEVELYGGRIFRVPYFNGFNKRQYTSEVRKLMDNHPEIRIVHGHLGSCAHIYLDEARKAGKISIAHSHNTNSKELSLKAIAYRLFTFKTRNKADFYFSCSEKAGEDRFGKKIVLDKTRYKVINNAIDCHKFTYDNNVRRILRDKLQLEDKYVIGHIGRFNNQKNHNFLIDIFEEYHRLYKDSILILVGDGDLKNIIEEKVNRLNLQKAVRFLGVKDNVNELLQAFDCIVFPSKYEGLPVTLIEAQASGLPCVISNTITKEVIVTDLVTQVPLSCDLSVWVSAIEKGKSIIRKGRENDLKLKGYEIIESSKVLEKFYIDCTK